MKILIGVTGSVATIKLQTLIEDIRKVSGGVTVEVQVIATSNALNFIKQGTIEGVQINTDELEWKVYLRLLYLYL